jgi:hypothetical protein
MILTLTLTPTPLLKTFGFWPMKFFLLKLKRSP